MLPMQARVQTTGGVLLGYYEIPVDQNTALDPVINPIGHEVSRPAPSTVLQAGVWVECRRRHARVCAPGLLHGVVG